jgi:hypothetical protein
MPKGREELRRGVRSLIEVTSREMEALSGEAEPLGPAPDEVPAGRPDRPILNLMRGSVVRPRPLPEPESQPLETSVIAAPHAPVPVPAAEPPAGGPVVAPEVGTVPAGARGGSAATSPALAPIYGIPGDAAGVHPKRGVCAAYYMNHACWEVQEAYCNQALHVCMLRDCPVYNLNREELERRFAAKFSHLW